MGEKFSIRRQALIHGPLGGSLEKRSLEDPFIPVPVRSEAPNERRVAPWSCDKTPRPERA